MFSPLRRLLLLAAGTLTSALFFAPGAFAVEAGQGAANAPNPTGTPHHAAAGSSLATWQWTLISVGIVAAVALLVAATLTLHRRNTRHALAPQTP